MIFTLRITALVLFSISLLSCKSGGPGPGEGDPTPVYTVSGWITTTVDSEPVGGVTITIAGRTAVSDSTGHYTVDSVMNGEHYVVPSRNGREFVPVNRFMKIAGKDLDSVNFEIKLSAELLSMPMVLIPAGTYTRGVDSAYNQSFSQCFPKHQVTITKPFYVAKYEVTQQQWAELMTMNDATFKGPYKPITHARWNDAIDFCNLMSDKHGYQRAYTWNADSVIWDRNANGYRLLTDAEFEYANAAGETRMYMGFDDPPVDIGDAQIDAIMSKLNQYYWMRENSRVNGVSQPQNIGLLKPNAWGLHDMIGNAEEWVFDDMGNFTADAKVDPVELAGDTFKASRGKSYDDGRVSANGVAYYSLRKRGTAHPASIYSRTGIRLARTP